MRAIYYPFNKSQITQSLLIQDESAKHLNVVRVRLEEEILILNGNGAKAFTKVSAIAKTQVELTVLKIEEAQPAHLISLAIAAPKKDAFEDILKMAVELGVLNIYPLSSEFSQYDYQPSERVQRILESALIQSNNPFMPIIHPQMKLDAYLEGLKSPLFFFNSKQVEEVGDYKTEGEKSILIGPEGGFSEAEIAKISARPNVFSIHLPTPILRAPTAVASSIGYLLSRS